MRKGEGYMHVKLRKVREAAGINQMELSHLIGYSSKNAYSQKERGERKFTLEEAKKIADFFGMTIEEIFFEDSLFSKEKPKLSLWHHNIDL